MKKIVCILLTLCLMLTAFAGCGKGGTNSDNDNGEINNTSNNPEENTTDLAFPEVIPEPKCLWENVNINKYDTKVSESKKSDDTYYIYTYCNIKEEYETFSPIPTKCAMGDTEVFYEVTTVQDFVNSGWFFADEGDRSATQSANTKEDILFKKDNVYVYVSVLNNTDKGIPIEKCTITGATITSNRVASYERNWSDLLLEGIYKVVTNQTTCAEVVEYFGLPNYIEISEFYYEGEFVHRYIQFEYYSNDSNKDTNIYFIFYQEDGECRLDDTTYGAYTFS